MSFDRRGFSQKRGRLRVASLTFIAVVRSWRSVAGNAPATPGNARTDPTRATATVTSSPVTCRLFDERRRVLKLRGEARTRTCRLFDEWGRVLKLCGEACRNRRLGLRAGRHGHRSQHEHRRRQNHREFSNARVEEKRLLNDNCIMRTMFPRRFRVLKISLIMYEGADQRRARPRRQTAKRPLFRAIPLRSKPSGRMRP